MNCTKEEFQKKIKESSIWLYYGIGSDDRIYASDINAFDVNDASWQKFNSSYCVWDNGTVLKDKAGLFRKLSVVSISDLVTIQPPVSGAYEYKIEWIGGDHAYSAGSGG